MTHKSGFIGLIGMPNAGKSTLLNAVLKQKLSITSSKPQTTRNRILGVLNGDNIQAALIDTPGIHRPRGRLHQTMVRSAQDIIPEMDAICWVLDADQMHRKQIRDNTIRHGGIKHIASLCKEAQHVSIAINKIDRLAKPKLLPMLAMLAAELPQAELVPISALKSDNIDNLIQVWSKQLPEGPPIFPKDHYTDVTERFLTSEIIREKVFHLTNQEIPYSVAVDVDAFEEQNKLIRIYAKILVERDSQKGIVIGKGGQKLKAIGERARQELEVMLGVKVWLDLHVAVKNKWTDNPRILRELGYE